MTTNLHIWHLSFSAIQFHSVILQNLTHHPVCKIHTAPFWSHERTFTFRPRSPRPYQDTKLLCLSTFANVKRSYEGEKDGRNAWRREGKGAQTGWTVEKKMIFCTVVVLFGDVRESLTEFMSCECVLVTDVHVHRTLLQNHSVILWTQSTELAVARFTWVSNNSKHHLLISMSDRFMGRQAAKLQIHWDRTRVWCI